MTTDTKPTDPHGLLDKEESLNELFLFMLVNSVITAVIKVIHHCSYSLPDIPVGVTINSHKLLLCSLAQAVLLKHITRDVMCFNKTLAIKLWL